MIIGIQILGICFGIFMLYLSYIYFKRKDFSRQDFVLWLLIWSCFLISIIIPEALTLLLRPLAITRVMDLLIISSLMALFLIVFVMYRINRKNEKKLKTIVKKLALKEK